MEDLKKNSNEDALKALADTMKLLGKVSSGVASTGVCVWVSPNGSRICSPISAADCALITGAVFVSGGTCP